MSLQITPQRQRKNPKKKALTVVMVLVLLAILATAAYLIFFRPPAPEQPVPEQPTAQTPEPVYHGRQPDCPEKYCISLTVSGDLLFHPLLWDNFATADGGYDFSPLFAAKKQYFDRTDLAVCNFETPIAPLGGPYVGYPVFAIPPQVADALPPVGYNTCTTDTNHSFDQGTAGINRLLDKLDELEIAHTGSYRTEAESTQPLILQAEGGKLALIGGTVSTNGETPDYDWQIDRMRDGESRAHDVERALTKAKLAREQGANVVVLQLHSVQEYITYADSWQQSIAHELADSGLFDLIYFHGSHSVQPLEKYGDVYIIYGLGNSVTVSAGDPERAVNDQGLTVRAQFASADGQAWQLHKLSYLPTFNKTGNNYAWCPLATDHPSGYCASAMEDAAMSQRIIDILYSINVTKDDSVVQPWLITEETE